MKYCIANWKMNMLKADAHSYFIKLKYFINKEKQFNGIKMIICPPYTLIDFIYTGFEYLLNEGAFYAQLGVQDFNPNKEGAYTGEISINMISDPGTSCIEWAIIGHSERRSLFKESNNFINLKVRAALHNGIRPILCIGETLDEREADRTEEILYNQLKHCLAGISCIDEDFLIAYEPVWAIGTGKNADCDTIQSTNSIIKDILKNLKYKIEKPKILYGGSVNNNNAENLSKICNLDGFLIGGASLDAEEWILSIYNR